MRLREPRWAQFAKAAVGDTAPGPAPRRGGRLRRQAGDVRRRLATARQDQRDSTGHHRPDIRLLPSVVAVWAMAAAAIAWSAGTVFAVLVLVGGGGLGTAACTLLRRRPILFPLTLPGSALRKKAARVQPAVSTAVPLKRTGVRTFQVPAGTGPTVLLACVCLLGVLLAVALRHPGGASSELELAASQGEELALTLEMATVPRRLESGHGPPQLVFDAFVIHATSRGRALTGRMPVRVVAAAAWAGLQPGDQAWTAGRIGAAGARDSVAGVLHPGSAPTAVKAGKGGVQAVVVSMRQAWKDRVDSVWAGRSPDTAGLLPGMVMGDRQGMGGDLNDAMKTVGLTHLTAVSGANCTLVLASLMLVLRSMHTPRLAAFAVSGAGLVGFVVLVGPDPSVLRAAVMGAIGAMAMLGGRPKRTGALLSVSIIVLLVADPWLAVDYAFILSVLATAGLHLVGRRCAGWLSALLPLWLAQAVAIPLAAQLFCAPVIVLLQARLTLYAIVANMAAAPVVALVTTVGTLGLLVAGVLPALAELCAAVSGAGAWWVGAVARWMSSLPAASLPWPGGVQGVVLMAGLNAAVLGGLYAVVERDRTAGAAAAALGWVPPWWRRRFGFTTAAALAAVVAGWWTAAVLRL